MRERKRESEREREGARERESERVNERDRERESERVREREGEREIERLPKEARTERDEKRLIPRNRKTRNREIQRQISTRTRYL